MYGNDVEKESFLDSNFVLGLFIGTIFSLILVSGFMPKPNDIIKRDVWIKKNTNKNAVWNGKKYVVSEFDLRKEVAKEFNISFCHMVILDFKIKRKVVQL